ncbi:MAG TPA: glycosyltransferase family 2 protein [Bryobacteraceae bacterium]|nr:glycosyltransferase family 2 protein [Bryobacteraceae bacterium]
MTTDQPSSLISRRPEFQGASHHTWRSPGAPAGKASVDVIIPCCNYGRFLRDSVQSVLAHQDLTLRVLIIDDASTDDTVTVAQELCALDSRVQFQQHADRMGHIATFNEGIDWADGDYMLILSADDLLLPGALNRAAHVMNEHPEVHLTVGWTVNGQPGVAVIPDPVSTCGYVVLEGYRFIEMECALAANTVFSPTAVVRTLVQKKLGGYHSTLPHSADMEMWLRFAAHGSVGIVNWFQAFYRVHQRNMSRQYGILEDLQQRKAAFEIFFQEFGFRVRQRTEYEGMVRRQLALAALHAMRGAYERQAYGEAADPDALLAFAQSTWPAIRWEWFNLVSQGVHKA